MIAGEDDDLNELREQINQILARIEQLTRESETSDTGSLLAKHDASRATYEINQLRLQVEELFRRIPETTQEDAEDAEDRTLQWRDKPDETVGPNQLETKQLVWLDPTGDEELTEIIAETENTQVLVDTVCNDDGTITNTYVYIRAFGAGPQFETTV